MDLKLGDSRLIISACAKEGLLRNQAAYVLATAYHETAHTVKPIYERGGKAYFNKYEPNTKIGKALGNVVKGDGYLFRGRGFVQLTGRANYTKAGRKLGIDLVRQPDLALLSENAAKILVLGMAEGWFTGRKIGDYVSLTKSDFEGARRVINGTDRASLIAGYAKDYDTLLKADGYGEAPKPALIPDNGKTVVVEQRGDKVTVTVAPPAPPVAAPAPRSKLSAIATVLALAAMALAGFWHHVTELFWSIF